MTLEERLKQTEEQFTRLEGERQALLQRVEAVSQELLRLQGAHRTIKEMLDAQDASQEHA